MATLLVGSAPARVGFVSRTNRGKSDTWSPRASAALCIAVRSCSCGQGKVITSFEGSLSSAKALTLSNRSCRDPNPALLYPDPEVRS